VASYLRIAEADELHQANGSESVDIMVGDGGEGHGGGLTQHLFSLFTPSVPVPNISQ